MEPKAPTKPRLSPTTWDAIWEYQRKNMGRDRMYTFLCNDENVDEFPGRTDGADRKKLDRALAWLRWADSSAAWSLRDTNVDVDDPTNAAPLFDVLRFLVEEPSCNIRQLTKTEARWIIRLRQAQPDMPAEEVWRMIRWYMLCIADRRDTGHLDTFIAFCPWRSPEAEARTAQFVDAWIEEIRAGRETVPSEELEDLAPLVHRRWQAENARPLAKWTTLMRGGRVKEREKNDNTSDR